MSGGSSRRYPPELRERPPAAPVPGAPSAPLPISGRPNAARKGALIASSSGLVMDAALAASAAAYEPAPAVKACTNWI